LQWGLSHESAVLAFCGGFGDFHADIDNGEAIQEETAIVVECRLLLIDRFVCCCLDDGHVVLRGQIAQGREHGRVGADPVTPVDRDRQLAERLEAGLSVRSTLETVEKFRELFGFRPLAGRTSSALTQSCQRSSVSMAANSAIASRYERTTWAVASRQWVSENPRARPAIMKLTRGA
jgi:hypothetical protein